MDVKDLNKSQLILLAILLSFVTSIVTGITTVTLLERAPSSVTVPINRVIRQTVEKIEQMEGKTTVETVVIKEEDLVWESLGKNQSALFAISRDVLDLDGQIIEVSACLGFAVAAEGILAADGGQVPEKGTYYIKNGSGKFKANFVTTDKKGFSFLKIGAPLKEESKLSFTVPVSRDIKAMKAGQKILILGNTISSFIFEGGEDLKINVTKANAGALVLNLDGEALGMALSRDSASFVPMTAINEALASLPKSSQ